MNSRITSGTQYHEEDFRGLSIDGNTFYAGEFTSCKFINCSFQETVFERCRFASCLFSNCDLSLSKIPGTVFVDTSFEASKIIGVNWAQADWPETAVGTPIKFSKSALNHSTFIGLRLQGLRVLDCTAVNVDFREADLSQADFSGSDLSESLFLHTNLSQADLSQARNYLIDPGANDLKKAIFSLPEAISLLYSMDIVLTGGEADLLNPS